MTPGTMIPQSGGDAAVPPLAFQGPRGELFWLLLKNFFLNLITFGIYRFWARTHLRSYFWRNLSISNEPLEYVGRGMELFIGFLIVVGILMSVGIPYTVFQFLMLSAPTPVRISLDVMYYLVLLVLIQIAIFRARRYRLTRTVWRGIRCGQDGDAMRFTLISCLWLIPVILTLGLAAPWRRVAMQRYLMENTRFGRQHFRFDGNGLDLFPMWFPIVASWLLMAGLLIVMNPEYARWFGDFYAAALSQDEQAIQALGKEFPKEVAFLWYPLLLIPVSIGLDLWYSVQQFKYFVNRTTFGDMTFTSKMPISRVVLYLAIYFLLVLLGIAATFGVFGLIIWLGTFGGSGDFMKAFAPVLMFPLFLLMFALLSILRIFWLYYELLRAACRTLDIQNLHFVDQVVQSADDGVRFGEGLADAFDLGDF